MTKELEKKRQDMLKTRTEELLDAVQRRMVSLDNPGFCLECGQEVDGCEPDARGYDCEICGGKGTVYAPEELVLF